MFLMCLYLNAPTTLGEYENHIRVQGNRWRCSAESAEILGVYALLSNRKSISTKECFSLTPWRVVQGVEIYKKRDMIRSGTFGRSKGNESSFDRRAVIAMQLSH
jgi:hypothetical protein